MVSVQARAAIDVGGILVQFRLEGQGRQLTILEDAVLRGLRRERQERSTCQQHRTAGEGFCTEQCRSTYQRFLGKSMLLKEICSVGVVIGAARLVDTAPTTWSQAY